MESSKSVPMGRPVSRQVGDRRPYEPPTLTAHGDLRGVTMGGSPGTGDSGATLIQEPG